jgi:hypothetical protein
MVATQNPRQQGRPGTGDFTGRQKEKANKDALTAQAERSAEVSMASAVTHEDELHGVFDPQSGQRIDMNEVIEVDDDDADEPATAAVFGFASGDEPVFTGQESAEEIAPVIAARKTFTQRPGEVIPSDKVKVRVEQDIEEMTFGFYNGEPNNYTFREGLMYEVSYALAEHLNNLGLLRQMITR